MGQGQSDGSGSHLLSLAVSEAVVHGGDQDHARDEDHDACLVEVVRVVGLVGVVRLVGW